MTPRIGAGISEAAVKTLREAAAKKRESLDSESVLPRLVSMAATGGRSAEVVRLATELRKTSTVDVEALVPGAVALFEERDLGEVLARLVEVGESALVDEVLARYVAEQEALSPKDRRLGGLALTAGMAGRAVVAEKLRKLAPNAARDEVAREWLAGSVAARDWRGALTALEAIQDTSENGRVSAALHALRDDTILESPRALRLRFTSDA